MSNNISMKPSQPIWMISIPIIILAIGATIAFFEYIYPLLETPEECEDCQSWCMGFCIASNSILDECVEKNMSSEACERLFNSKQHDAPSYCEFKYNAKEKTILCSKKSYVSSHKSRLDCKYW